MYTSNIQFAMMLSKEDEMAHLVTASKHIIPVKIRDVKIDSTHRGDSDCTVLCEIPSVFHNYARYGGTAKNALGIKKVIFNDPATIVIWENGDKTVVKAQNNEEFDPEKGLAMAIAKKALGNKGNYYDTIKKWTDEYEETREGRFEAVVNRITSARNIAEESEKHLKIEKARVAYNNLRAILDDDYMSATDVEAKIEEAVGFLGDILGLGEN